MCRELLWDGQLSRDVEEGGADATEKVTALAVPLVRILARWMDEQQQSSVGRTARKHKGSVVGSPLVLS